MKTAEDFRRAMGEGDEGFHRRVQETLAALPEEEPVVKKKMSVGLAIAFALLMMTMVAAVAANQWGLLDFLSAGGNDAARELVQMQTGATMETEHATFTVREHVFDGRGIYIVVSAHPKEDGVMLLPLGMTKDSWVETMVPEAKQMTVGEYAQQQGYTSYVWVGANAAQNMGLNNIYFSRREHMEEDGTLVMMLSYTNAEKLPEELPLTLLFGSKKHFLGDDSNWMEETPRVSRAQIELTLRVNAAEEKHWRSAAPVVYDEIGMTVDEVRMVQTPLAIYWELDYTAHHPSDNHRYGNTRTPGYWFKFVREDGKLFNMGGVAYQMRYTVLDTEGGRGRWTGTLAVMEIPEVIHLRGILGDFTFFDARQTLPITLIPVE